VLGCQLAPTLRMAVRIRPWCNMNELLRLDFIGSNKIVVDLFLCRQDDIFEYDGVASMRGRMAMAMAMAMARAARAAAARAAAREI